jgi:cytochrome c-type biogenesis protein CcmH/NrfG
LKYQKIVTAALVSLFLVAAAGAAQAECAPGQMQEASRAYLSAAQFLNAQQWDQAIARLQSIANVCPEHVETNRGLGTAYAGKDDYAQAAVWFERVIDLRGDDVEAGDFANLAKAYAKQKQYKEARGEYMKAEILAPDDCGVLFNLGVMHFAAGFYTQSVDVLEATLDQCPQIREHALKQLARSATAAAKQQRQAGNNSRATFYDELAMQYGGAAGGSTSYDMVKTKMSAKDYAGAIELLDQMLAKNPEQPNALLTLARAQDAAGRKNESIASYRRYLELKPDNTEEIGTMLQVMVESGQAAAARDEAAKAYAEHQGLGRKGLAPIVFSWGLALEQTGDYELAKGKFAECAAANHDKYSGPASTYVERMDGLIAQSAAERKKARQGG